MAFTDFIESEDMKTYETEKHNIPEGATHYVVCDNVYKFAWAKYVGSRLYTKKGEQDWIQTGWLGNPPNVITIPTRTKTEYVKVTESIFDLKDEFERGELYSKHKNKEKYYQVNTEIWVISAMSNNNLYRRIETPITERDEFIDKAMSTLDCHGDGIIKDMVSQLFDSGKFKLTDKE